LRGTIHANWHEWCVTSYKTVIFLGLVDDATTQRAWLPSMSRFAELNGPLVAIGLNGLNIRGFTGGTDRGLRRADLCRCARALLGVICLFLMVACNAQSMTLSWQDTSENEDGFRIYRIEKNQKHLIAEVGRNVTQYVDKNASPDACYVVTAFNAAGESTTSNSACLSKLAVSK
jgi:hypothetical protein